MAGVCISFVLLLGLVLPSHSIAWSVDDIPLLGDVINKVSPSSRRRESSKDRDKMQQASNSASARRARYSSSQSQRYAPREEKDGFFSSLFGSSKKKRRPNRRSKSRPQRVESSRRPPQADYRVESSGRPPQADYRVKDSMRPPQVDYRVEGSKPRSGYSNQAHQAKESDIFSPIKNFFKKLGSTKSDRDQKYSRRKVKERDKNYVNNQLPPSEKRGSYVVNEMVGSAKGVYDDILWALSSSQEKM